MATPDYQSLFLPFLDYLSDGVVGDFVPFGPDPF